jgi:hypothetical protein
MVWVGVSLGIALLIAAAVLVWFLRLRAVFLARRLARRWLAELDSYRSDPDEQSHARFLVLLRRRKR